jgi:hypothetical protein
MPHSPSVLRNKSNSHLEAMPTALSAVPHAARQEKYGKMATVPTTIGIIAIATNLNAKCFLRYVPSAAQLPRCHSSLVKIDRCIVEIATTRSD